MGGKTIATLDPDLRSLLVEADSFISHMRHRGSWPEDEFAVDGLIGRLRAASESEPAEGEREWVVIVTEQDGPNLRTRYCGPGIGAAWTTDYESAKAHYDWSVGTHRDELRRSAEEEAALYDGTDHLGTNEARLRWRRKQSDRFALISRPKPAVARIEEAENGFVQAT